MLKNRSLLTDQKYLTNRNKDLDLFSSVQKKKKSSQRLVLTAYDIVRGSQEGPHAHQMQSK